MCGDYVCNVHQGQHVHECDCPGIEKWVEFGYSPSFTRATDQVKDWVAQNPFDPEED